MKLISCYEEYKIKADAIRQDGCISNCYFLLNQVKDLIEREKLYIENQGPNLFILEKEDSFYRFYYYIKEMANIAPLDLDMPAVVEFVFKKQLSEKQCYEIDLIQKLGFSLGRESERMFISSSSVKLLKNPKRDNTISVEFAKMEDVDSIMLLLTKNFDPLYAFLPDLNTLKQLIENQKIIAAYSDSMLVGVLNMDLCRKVAWIRHFVIKEQFRGRGYSQLLLNEYHKTMKDRAIEFMHWVDRNNQTAINMYRKAGYKFDGRRANEYVCR